MVVVGKCAKCGEPIDNEVSGYVVDKGKMYHVQSEEYQQQVVKVTVEKGKRFIHAKIIPVKKGKACYKAGESE
ncbi:MAG: hypothetical protein QXO67_03815 [Candidatus Bathyarchaeia archaeon]